MRLPFDMEHVPRRWSMRQRPGYVEAYPTFAIGEAERELRQGRDHLLWRDHRGIIAGAASVRQDGRVALTIFYTVEEREYLDAAHGELTLPLVWKGSEENNLRPFSPCPLCARAVDVLVFTGTWRCIRHGLRHRSAVLAREVRWSEELDGLDGALGSLAALGAPDKAHSRQVACRDMLLAKLGGRRVEANTLLRVRMSRTWVRPVPVSDGA